MAAIRLGAALVAAIFLAAACGGSSTPAASGARASAVAGGGTSGEAAGGGTSGGPPGGISSGPVAGAGGSSLADAAATVKDWCALLPNDVITGFAPGASPASAGTYPGECVASNGTGALDFHYNTGFGTSMPSGAPAGSEVVPGLAAFAYLDRPSKDEVELYVTLSPDSEWGLFIDVAGHDGKDHKADAVAIAQAVLAKLQSV
jgi:hypothetical protein